jgi:heme oxygenase (biliverdin-IX-beta and delta-forming)
MSVAARKLVREQRLGALATISLHRPGWPFGSIAPYALTARGEPILLMSSLAQHTKNALADPRASLLVQEQGAGDDPQAFGRVTILGRISRASDEPEARARYFSRHPKAARTAAGHDFHYYVLSIEEARFIGGFGEIHWLAAEALLIDPAQDPLRPHQAAICKHMNDDHAEALSLYCRHFRGLSGENARMIGIDSYGFDVAQKAELLRFDFAQPLSTPEDARKALVAMVKAARG